MSVYDKLIDIQTELKVPKTQYNSFGDYYYRNCEDILETLKPICKKYKVVVFLTDKILMLGNRYYIEATAHFVDIETNEDITVSACAREDEAKKKMDGSQLTGASSSYARKYALNGLFDIDDTKDSDTTNDGSNQQDPKQQKQQKQQKPDKDNKNIFSEINVAILAYSKQSGMTTKDVVAYISGQIGKPLNKDLPNYELNKVLDMVKSWSSSNS